MGNSGSHVLFLGFLLSFIGCSVQETDKQESWLWTGFVKVDSLNPILEPAGIQTFKCPIENREIAWESRNVLNPSAVIKDGKIHLLYRAQDRTGTSRIGMAISKDGLNFERLPTPVFYPSEDDMKEYEWNYLKRSGSDYDRECVSCLFDGVEDPRVVSHPEGGYVMTYTAYDGKTARLALATSQDLISWTKHGLVLSDSLYKDHWSKSGAIITERVGDQMIATKINGQYWMYFGDKQFHMAASSNLIHWIPLTDKESGKLISVLHPRPGFFDSRLVEPGPYAQLNDNGVRLIYNASNASNHNDPSLPIYTYAAGQALFDASNPLKLIDRTQTYFIKPDKSYEKIGEVNEVCFVEGLVPHEDRWFLYYGTADTRIAVAVAGQ
ncbi:MAG: glycoside hydrolase family 130 protein [Cyclobacteriaceae bacterium]